MNMKEILQSFTSMIKTNVSEEYGSAKDNNHTHSNKTTLDNITDTQVYAWGKGASHAGDTTVHVTQEEKEKIVKSVQLVVVDNIPATNTINTIYVLSSGKKLALCDENNTLHMFSESSIDVLESDPTNPPEGYMWISK